MQRTDGYRVFGLRLMGIACLIVCLEGCGGNDAPNRSQTTEGTTEDVEIDLGDMDTQLDGLETPGQPTESSSKPQTQPDAQTDRRPDTKPDPPSNAEPARRDSSSTGTGRGDLSMRFQSTATRIPG